jgi:hypothetical protein
VFNYDLTLGNYDNYDIINHDVIFGKHVIMTSIMASFLDEHNNIFTKCTYSCYSAKQLCCLLLKNNDGSGVVAYLWAMGSDME